MEPQEDIIGSRMLGQGSLAASTEPGTEWPRRTFWGIDLALWPGGTCLWKLGEG